MITLVWFRSANMPQAADIFDILVNGTAHIHKLEGSLKLLDIPWHIPAFLLIFLLMDLFIMKERADTWFGKFSKPLRWGMYAFMLMCIWIWGGAVNHPFVYFQF